MDLTTHSALMTLSKGVPHTPATDQGMLSVMYVVGHYRIASALLAADMTALVGGKRKQIDRGNPKTTALRELSEETAGIVASKSSLNYELLLHVGAPLVLSWSPSRV